ncbi:hypothetical protein FA13DRAFT_1524566 [Coprinellus micaceus]|uniref:Uncharacterized protein n=1 Tax=Coprinellus micaceus TaxID=71717 RepID=A0A4Y7SJF5_COPMI|nr:hypothetical protein FA13DRAFT_1524566 [Coprinellus micaceus]
MFSSPNLLPAAKFVPYLPEESTLTHRVPVIQPRLNPLTRPRMPNRRIRHHARLFTPAPRPRGEYLPSPPERHHRRPVLPRATCVVLHVGSGEDEEGSSGCCFGTGSRDDSIRTRTTVQGRRRWSGGRRDAYLTLWPTVAALAPWSITSTPRSSRCLGGVTAASI